MRPKRKRKSGLSQRAVPVLFSAPGFGAGGGPTTFYNFVQKHFQEQDFQGGAG
jgi:hypothetical protein